MANEPFQTGPDLTDPKVAAQHLLDIAGGLDQQATASQMGSALGGHPYPAFFFGRGAEVCRAAAKLLEGNCPTEAKIGAAEFTTPTTPPGPSVPPAAPPQPAEPVVLGSMPSGDEREAMKRKARA